MVTKSDKPYRSISNIALVRIGIGLVLLYILVNVGFGAKKFNEMRHLCTNERTSNEVLTKWLTNDMKFDMEGFSKKYKIENIQINSSLGDHVIPASYIYANGNTTKKANTIIMVHGLLGNKLSNYPYSEMFLRLGYNVITYDQRCSGENNAKYTTYGYLESQDTIDYAAYIENEAGDDYLLGIWGQSMGGATVLDSLMDEKIKKHVDFIVLDSPLSDGYELNFSESVSDVIRYYVANGLNKCILGFTFGEASVYPNANASHIPLLMVSSKADNRVPFKLQKSIYNTYGESGIRKGEKELYIVNDSNHSEIYYDHKDEYTNKNSPV